MKNFTNFFLRMLTIFCLALTILVGYPSLTHSQTKYPTKAIDIIVPFSPGGATDLSSRLTAAYVNKKWRVPVSVINKPGGNMVPANLEIYSAKADGYTLLGEASSICYLDSVVKDLPFKVMDRTFIGITNIGPQLLFVPTSSPFKSLKELAEWVKKNPEKFTWVSRGGADPSDYHVRAFLKEINVDFKITKPIMSQGAAQAVVLVAGGHAILASGSASSALPALKAGTIRALSVSGKDRFIDLPDVPTSKEAGFPEATVDNWMGITGPPNLPSYVVDIWDKALQEMLKEQDQIKKLKNIGSMPFYHNGHQMREIVLKTTENVRNLWMK